MQIVELHQHQSGRKPSARLYEKIKSCASAFRSLADAVNDVIKLGQSEGFTPLEIGQFIRIEMLKAGLHRATVARYLPAELKQKPRGKQIAVTAAAEVVSSATKGTRISRNLRQNIKALEFQATITINVDKRKINIPAKFRDQVDSHFTGRKINVKIW